MNINDKIDSYSLFSDEFKETFKFMVSNLKTDKNKNEYFLNVRQICGFCNCDFLKLDGFLVKNFFDNIANKYTAKSLRFKLSCLRSVAKNIDASLGTSIFECFSFVSLKDYDMYISVKDVPTYDDIDKVLTYLKNSNDLTIFTAVSLALKLALTTDEVCALKQEQFFCDKLGNHGIRFKGVVFGGMDRNIFVPDDLVLLIENLAALRDNNSSSYLFLDKRGNPMSKRTLQYSVRNACIAAGVNPFGLSQLRTLSVALMFKNGSSTSDVSKHTGNVDKWFFRYERVVSELERDSNNNNHLLIRW